VSQVTDKVDHIMLYRVHLVSQVTDKVDHIMLYRVYLVSQVTDKVDHIMSYRAHFLPISKPVSHDIDVTENHYEHE
jgi:phage gp16-like protein